MNVPYATRHACAVAALMLAGTHAVSQGYPAKQVRFVVGFPPGGATDVVARTISQHLAEALGQPVVVDNRAGAASNIGAEIVATSPRDGTRYSWAQCRSRSIRACTENCRMTR